MTVNLNHAFRAFLNVSYSVYQYFPLGDRMLLASNVDAATAVKAFKEATMSPSARCGTTVKVMIEDSAGTVHDLWIYQGDCKLPPMKRNY